MKISLPKVRPLNAWAWKPWTRPLAAAFILALVFSLAACQKEPPWPSDLEPVAHPDLEAVEKTAREQITERREALAELLDRGAGEPFDLAAAYGRMGEVYHAYELLEPAAACYRNAVRLDPESFLWTYLDALRAAEAGDLKAAADGFARALELKPDYAPARLRRGAALLGLGETAAAEAQFAALRDGVVSGTGDATAAGDATAGDFTAAVENGLGRAAAARGDHAAAVEHLARVLELQPSAGSARHALGLSLRHLGRLDEARQRLESPASGEVVFPDRYAERLEDLARGVGSLLRRANRALVAGRLDDAASFYRQALELDAASLPARRNLALVLMRQGNAAAAVRELEQALELAGDDAALHFDHANALRAAGRPDEALAAYRRALELAPDLGSARFNLANLLGELGRWQEAHAELERLLESQPDDPRARYLAAMAEHRLGRSAAARQQLEALLAENPENLPARQGLATVLVESGDPGQALAVLRSALDLDLGPGGEALLAQLGELAWKTGRRDEALAAWRRAVELAPASSAAYTRLANGLQLVGQRAEAAELFARAVELDPQNATAWLSEASLRILAGEYARAAERLEAALAQVGEHPGLLHTLARLLATAPAPVRDGTRALTLAQRAQALEPSLEHAATVAMALAAQGRYAEAAQFQSSLLQQANGRAPAAVVRQLAAHLELYRKGRPVQVGAPGS